MTISAFFSILKNMKTQQRRRAEILAEIESIPYAVQGKICENKKTLASGDVAVYHNLQWWSEGRNHAIHIAELSAHDAGAILAAGDTTKKKSTRSASRAGPSSRR